MKKGSVIFHAGSEPQELYVQLEGQSIYYTLTNDGNRKIIFINGANTVLSESVIQPAAAVAYCELIRDSVIFSIPYKELQPLMQSDFSLTQALVLAQEHKLKRTSHQLKNTFGSLNMEKKMAAKLWKLGRDFGIPGDKPGSVVIDITMSVTFLADLIGAPRESVSRICRSLILKGLIEMGNKTVTVPDMNCLSAFYKSYCLADCGHCSRKLRKSETTES